MKRIVVVGPTRGGTSLIQRVVATVPGIIPLPESHLYRVGFRRHPLSRFTVDEDALSSGIEHFLDRCGLPDAADGFLSSLRRPSRNISVLQASSLVREVFDDVARRHGATGWVEKTPAHFQKLPAMIAGLSPDVVVHVTRNCRDTVSSRQRASADWGKPSGRAVSVAHWIVAAQVAGIRCDYGELVVRLEDVQRRSADVTDLLASALDGAVSFEPSLIWDPIGAVAPADEPWRAGASGAISEPPTVVDGQRFTGPCDRLFDPERGILSGVLMWSKLGHRIEPRSL